MATNTVAAVSSSTTTNRGAVVTKEKEGAVARARGVAGVEACTGATTRCVSSTSWVETLLCDIFWRCSVFVAGDGSEVCFYNGVV